MAEKSGSSEPSAPIVALVDEKTMAEVERLAAFYGVDVEEVLTELIRLDLEGPPEGATLH